MKNKISYHLSRESYKCHVYGTRSASEAVYEQSPGNAMFAKCVIRSIIFKCALEICYRNSIFLQQQDRMKHTTLYICTVSHVTTQKLGAGMPLKYQMLAFNFCSLSALYVDFAPVPPHHTCKLQEPHGAHLIFVFQRQQIHAQC